jgi:hypothetical protein
MASRGREGAARRTCAGGGGGSSGGVGGVEDGSAGVERATTRERGGAPPRPGPGLKDAGVPRAPNMVAGVGGVRGV